MEQASCEWTEIVIAMMSIISPILITVLGWFVWNYQKIKEPEYRILQEKYKQSVQAKMKVWSMLKYLSRSENQHTVFIKRENNGKICYHARREQAEQFENEIVVLFYDEGYGLFLTKEVKSLLFETRNQFHRLLDTDRDEKLTMIVVKNPKLVDRIHEIYNELNPLLKA